MATTAFSVTDALPAVVLDAIVRARTIAAIQSVRSALVFINKQGGYQP